MFPAELSALATSAAALLRDRGETISVAEGSAGGLISAALLSVPGASAYYHGGAIPYTGKAARAFVRGEVEAPAGMRGATEDFALYLARSVRLRVETTWGISEAGATGPANPYGDPAGHAWFAVAGPVEATRHVLTGVDDRAANMFSFATAALDLLVAQLRIREDPARP
jgi:nicotinamide-nucleotide amidase